MRTLGLFFILCHSLAHLALAQDVERTIAGREDWDTSDGGADGWDLTVVLTTPIAPPLGFSVGMIENISYYIDDGRFAEEHTIAPVLVKYTEDTDEYTVEAVGKIIVTEENGPQEEIAFELERGSNLITVGEQGVTWHAAVFQGHPDFDNDQNGALIPFGASGGEGMFAYNSQPDEELEIGQVLNNDHGSDARNYSFNLGISWTKGDDTDGDGIIDALEADCGLDPNVADSDSDKDEDGLTALQEINETGTGCNDPDSDDDGLKDGVETKTGKFESATDTGTDPLNADTDGDGLKDGVENGSGIFVSAENPGTDPNKEDSDGDTFKDNAEIAAGTDPTDAASFPETLGDLPEFGAEDWDVGDGGPDGWDLTVVLTTPIEFPDGESTGTVEYINYFHAESRTVGDHTIAPVLVKYIEDDDEYIVVGVGTQHVADESGPQEKIPFGLTVGSNVLEETDGVTWHAAVFQGHPGFGNNAGGAVIPFANGGGDGMFAYDSQPEEELEEEQVLENNHASDEGGRHYAFNLGISFGSAGGPQFEITDISHAPDGVAITWNSKANRIYSVEYRETLDDNIWIELDDGVEATGDTTTFTDSAANAAKRQGWYRVRDAD